MKRISVFLLIFFIPIFNLSAQECLHGKVRVVNSFPDYKVKVVNSFPDLKVQKVTSFPDKCGQWQFVEAFEDFTIQFVDEFEDFTIQYVDAFPEIPNGNPPSSLSTNTQEVDDKSIEMGNIKDWKNPVLKIFIKNNEGNYVFSIPRTKNRWFPTKARVQVVDTLADIYVMETYSIYANFQIMKVDATPTKDLQWQFVDSDPDFTIQFVHNNDKYDITIMYFPNHVPNPKNLMITTPDKIYFAPQQ